MIFEEPQQLSKIEREVAGLLGADVYPGKRVPPFTDSQPMLITSLLLNAAACHLRDPSVCGDSALAPHYAFHLAVAAVVLQPRYSKAYHRVACALGKMGNEECLRSAHAIMRHVAQLEGRPAAELLAQLPPLPLSAVKMPFGGGGGAMHHVVLVMYEWPLLMRAYASPGQNFLLQLPGGLGKQAPWLVHAGIAACDAELRVDDALKAKERGNTAFIAGDTAGALREYTTGIDHLRALTALHLQNNSEVIKHGWKSLSSSDPTTPVAKMRGMLAPLVDIEMFPYQSQQSAAWIRELTTVLFRDHPPLPPTGRLPDCKDLPSLIECFWGQLIAAFLEPYGGTEGILVNQDAWTHAVPNIVMSTRFLPVGPSL
jgi:hypothetical protein